MRMVSLGRQSDAAQGLRVALSKCRLHNREGKIKRSVGELKNGRSVVWKGPRAGKGRAVWQWGK